MELVTPTGAAIVTTLARFERPQMRLSATGYGAGGRDPEGWPNVMRIWLGDADVSSPSMLLVQTNIDDMNPEIFGYVQELLFAAGAADVWLQPIQMKKNRPGIMLSVLCAVEREDAVSAILLRETSTLGVRVSRVARHEAQREVFEFDVEPRPRSGEGEAPRRRAAPCRAGVRGVPEHRGSAGDAARGRVPDRRARGARAARRMTRCAAAVRRAILPNGCLRPGNGRIAIEVTRSPCAVGC